VLAERKCPPAICGCIVYSVKRCFT
jgi:hypothetical protein